MPSFYEYLIQQQNSQGIPLKPFDIVNWAPEQNRPTTKALLTQIATQIKREIPDLDEHVVYVSSQALIMDQIFHQLLGQAPIKGLKEQPAYTLRLGLQVMVGLALNATHWDYSPIRFYNEASSVEAASGYTTDFANKHISGTEDEKSSKSVAKERMKDVGDKTVPALGKIVTRRSGAIVKADVGEFTKEILSRQQEFTNTYTRLSGVYGARWRNLTQSEGFSYYDGITFRTKRTYRMFEFVEGKGGAEEPYYIDFSLSADATGRRWAVHHLAGTRTENVLPEARTGVDAMLGQQQGQAAVDPMTYMNQNPFEGFRRIA